MPSPIPPTPLIDFRKFADGAFEEPN